MRVRVSTRFVSLLINSSFLIIFLWNLNSSFLSQDTLQCVTKKECLVAKKYLHESECVGKCPYGFTVNSTNNSCEKCQKTCSSEYCTLDDPLVQHLSDIEPLQGCQKLNSSLILKFIGDVNIKDIEKCLGNLRKIEGYLKIYRSKYFESLYFFENLEYISGVEKEHNQYGLIIYDNRNLKDLWTINKSLRIESGGVYIEKNWKLCNKIANNFSKAIDHNRQLDRIQRNDREVLCHPIKLDLYLKVRW